ncbi:aspartyl protease, partial [Gregarina niphandrodes]
MLSDGISHGSKLVETAGAINVSIKKPRTTKERYDTIKGTVNALERKYVDKAAKLKSRREASKARSQRSRVGAAVVEDDVTSDNQSDDSSNQLAEQSVNVGITEHAPTTTKHKLQPRLHMVHAFINNHKIGCFPDTGAERSVISAEVADKLNLVSTEQCVSLKGVSDTPLRARITEPVVVSVGGRSCSTSLVVVQPRVPTLLGVDVLVKTGLLEVDEAGMRLNIPALYTEVEPPKQVRKDVVSGVDETKSDEELLRGARQEVQTQAQHLSGDDFEQLWSVLQTYSDVFLRPRSGQVEYQARFEVEGRPHKARLRPLPPTAEAELKRQVESQLDKGVIRPSKSQWAACPFVIPKKTGDYRVVIDYRVLNSRMKDDAFPIPLLWHSLQKSAG